ncbi:MAG: sigma-70 family RNA polymerase sigma factor [Planctomycetota bacterium]|jgi:RNA polymerase primary sigma factor
MKLTEVKKRVRAAHKNGALLVKDLDEILKDGGTFERNVNELIKSLKDLGIRQDRDDADETLISKGKKSKSNAYSSRDKDLMYEYIKEVIRMPRMSREDEQRYSKRLEFFKKRLISGIQHECIPEEAKKLLLRFQECPGNPAEQDINPLCKKLGKCPRGKAGFVKSCCENYNGLRAQFVERNLRLVLNLTRQYRTYGIPMMDLVQEGNAALIRAAEKYDWRKGVRFQTYANFWIKQAVERCITANKGIVRVPNYLQQKIRRFQRNGIIPSDKTGVSVKEMSEAFDLSNEVAGHLLETGRGYVSLDSFSSDDNENSISSMISTEDEETMPEGEFLNLKGRLKDALGVLSEQEQFIISHRFGLEGMEIKTLDEIGKLMNVSRERIRQLQIRALQKLKRPSLLKRLAPFLP